MDLSLDAGQRILQTGPPQITRYWFGNMLPSAVDSVLVQVLHLVR
jgi:hypothetical protein